MASGHVNRTNRPNTWLHRPSLRREDSPCQPGAVHTWHILLRKSAIRREQLKRSLLSVTSFQPLPVAIFQQPARRRRAPVGASSTRSDRASLPFDFSCALVPAVAFFPASCSIFWA